MFMSVGGLLLVLRVWCVCLVMMLYFVGGLMSMGCFCEFVLLM